MWRKYELKFHEALLEDRRKSYPGGSLNTAINMKDNAKGVCLI